MLWSWYTTLPLNTVSVLRQSLGDHILVQNHLGDMRRLRLPGLDVQDQDVTCFSAIRSGFPPMAADLPFRTKLFWLSVRTS